MKLSYFFAAALIAGLAFSSSANATTVDLSGDQYKFTDDVVAGQTGNITTDEKGASPGMKKYGYAGGTLAANTQIVFTYTASTAGTLFADSSKNGKKPHFNIEANSATLPSISWSNPLVTVMANFSGVTGTATIQNMSSVAVNFFTYFLASKNESATASYVTSAVPLPPAVILFASGLLALVGFSAYRKKANRI